MFALLALIAAAAVPATVALVKPDGVGRLPALGWNSWNAFGCDIDEEKFLTAANKLVELGLKDAGYQYVNIDDCWSVKSGRDNVTGELVSDPVKFPDGINGTAAKIHALGLSIGIYSSAGTETCAGYPASIGYETLDAATWASWGIDYLKYDNCNVPNDLKDSCDACVPDGPANEYVNGTCTDTTGLCPDGYDYSQSNTAKRFRTMRDALANVSHPILYSLCEWGYAGVQSWGNDTGNSWRSTNDINATWPRILQILNQNSFHLTHTDFWGHSDADMLEVGNGALTPAQSRSHLSLWAAMKSPLLIGADLANLSAANVALLANRHLLAFHQDPARGPPATPYRWGTNPDWTFNASFPAEFWAGQSGNGTTVVWMFNPAGSGSANRTAEYGEVPGLREGATYYVTDAWGGKGVCSTGRATAEVEAHDTSVLLFQQGGCSDEGGRERVLRAGEWY